MLDTNDAPSTATLRGLLPTKAFQPRPGRILYAVVNVAILSVGVIEIRTSSSAWVEVTAAIVNGHSLFCLALFAHELSHGAIVRSGRMRAALEYLCWTPNWIAPTLWRRVHATHHRETNTLRDPDRRFTHTEGSISRRWYSLLLYPHNAAKGNPLVFLHFIPYIAKQTAGALLDPAHTLSSLPSRCKFTQRERLAIVAEIFLIIVVQLGLFVFVQCSSVKFVFASLLPLAVASALVMSYVFTNHFLSPLHDCTDVLRSTTSVIVPKLIDWLHLNFSYHAEHHLFPKMDSSFYPALSSILSEQSPKYRRIRILQAWQLLWQQAEYGSLAAEVRQNDTGSCLFLDVDRRREQRASLDHD